MKLLIAIKKSSEQRIQTIPGVTWLPKTEENSDLRFEDRVLAVNNDWEFDSQYWEGRRTIAKLTDSQFKGRFITLAGSKIENRLFIGFI